MVKAVIFDLGGVLVNTPSSGNAETYRREIKLHRKVLNFALKLKQQGINIAILSNTNPVHSEILKKFGFFYNFKVIVLSYEVSLEKPNPKIYKLTLQKLGVPASETLYIDDEPKYVKIANSLGMKGIVYKNPKQLKEILKSTTQ